MKNNKMIKNAIWIIVCKVAKAFLTLIVTMFTARYLGSSNYGLVNYAASLVTFVTPIMKLGMDSIMVHEVIQNKKNEGAILGTAITLNVISAFLCIIGVVSFTLIVNAGESDTTLVCFLYSLLLIFQAIEMVQYWFQSKLLSKYTALSMLIAYIFSTIFQLYLLITNKDVHWFALSHSMEFMIIALLMMFFYKKKGKQKLSFSFPIARKLLSKGKYYIISGMMITIFSQTDKIMIKLMIDNSAVGIYSAAATCGSMTSFIFVAIIDSWRPLIFESKKISEKKYEKNIIRLYSVIIYSSLFQSLFTTVLSPLIIGVMYGATYSQAIDALRIIVWFTTFSYLGTIRDIWILAENKQHYLWMINAMGAITNIVLNTFFIPIWGICGASFASLLTQIFTNVIVGCFFKPIRHNNRLMFRALNPKQLIIILFKLTEKNKTVS